MRSRRKHVYLILFLIGFVLVLAVGAVGVLYGSSYYSDSVIQYSDPVVLEMKMGETLDLSEYCEDWNDLVFLDGDGGTAESISAAQNNLFLDGKGRLHAKKSGVYRFGFSGGRLFRSELLRETIRSFCVVVHDTDYSDYMPVPTYSELERGIRRGERKFIQTNDIVVSDRDVYDLLTFEGFLVNPNGYEISVRDNLPLFYQLGENAIVSGLRVNDGGEGFRPVIVTDSDGYPVTDYGMIALGNLGTISGCAVAADLYGDVYVGKQRHISLAGIAGMNRVFDGGALYVQGSVLRCSFTGRAYAGYTYGIVCDDEYGCVADCTVRADLYPREGLSSAFACTLYHMPLRGIHRYADEFTAIAANGNRVFDLSGRREVDFSKPVTYAVQNNFASQKWYANGYAGAIVPRDPADFSDENFYLFSVTDADGRSYSTEKPVFFGEENTTLYYEFRYRQAE